jgi:hypothetical protein
MMNSKEVSYRCDGRTKLMPGQADDIQVSVITSSAHTFVVNNVAQASLSQIGFHVDQPSKLSLTLP